MNKFNIYISIILHLLNAGLVCSGNGHKSPPKILNNWKVVDYYQEKTKHNFNCMADGTDLTYSLYLNESFHSKNKNGIFTLEDDEDVGLAGVYQCKVTNTRGTSITDTTELKKAVNVSFSSRSEIFAKINIGIIDLKVICNFSDNVVPDPIITWYQKTYGGESELVQITGDIQFDGKKTLYLRKVTEYDGYSFWCRAANWFLRRSEDSPMTIVNVSYYTDFTVPVNLLTWSSSPYIIGDNPDTVVGLIGGNITLRCLFSGNPKPKHDWLKDGKEIDQSQWGLKFNGTEITSKLPLDMSFKGTYTCRASTSINHEEKKIDLFIRAPPFFLNDHDKPRDVTVPVGDSTIFRCSPLADPEADFKWYRNGELLILSEQPNYNLDSTGKELTISNVSSAKNDSCVIRCEACNKYGHVSYEGYLAVIEPIKLEKDQYKDVLWKPKQNLKFFCNYTEEEWHPVHCNWFHNNKSINNGDESRVTVDDKGTLSIITETDDDGGRGRLGTYKVVASNNFSIDSNEFKVLEPIKLDKDQYKDVLWKPKQNLKFFCNYMEKEWYPVHCSWFHNNKSINNGDDERVTLDDKGTLSIITEKDDNGGRSRLGTYKVIASNNHSTDSKEFKVIDNVPEPEPNVDKHVTNLWWISLVVIAILFLLLLLLLLFWCCCCRKRQKEDYHVDKQERLVGKDPVKELHNIGFHDYQAQESKENISFTVSSGTLPHIQPSQLRTTYYTKEIVDSDTISSDQAPLATSHPTPYRRSIMSDSEIMIRRDISDTFTNTGTTRKTISNLK